MILFSFFSVLYFWLNKLDLFLYPLGIDVFELFFLISLFLNLLFEFELIFRKSVLVLQFLIYLFTLSILIVLLLLLLLLTELLLYFFEYICFSSKFLCL